MKRELFALGVLMGGLLSSVSATAAEANDPVVSAYFVSWGVYARDYHVSDIPAHLVTHVNYAFAKPVFSATNNTGAVVSADPYADLQKLYPGDTTNQPIRGCFNQLQILKTNHPHIRTLISVGGWTLSGDFSDIAASANARQTFAASCVEFVTAYGFDGVDLDWEFPVSGGASGTKHRPEDADNLVLLLQELRDALDAAETANGKTYLLSITGAAPYNSVALRYRLAAMAPLVDWIHVMAYNYSGAWSAVTGHIAPLFANPAAEVPRFNVDETVRAYLGGGVPASQLVLGVPFVGFGLKNVSPTNNGLFQSHGGASVEGTWGGGFFDYEDLEDGTQGHGYVNTNGYVRYWDNASAAPYLYSASNQVFISYENQVSIGLKTEYATSKKLRGMMYWSMDADAEDARLQTMIHAMLHPPNLSAIRAVTSPDSGGQDVELEWYARTGQTYSVWFSTNLVGQDWERATWLQDGSGSVRESVIGSNTTVRLIDANPVGRGFYQLRLPADGQWP